MTITLKGTEYELKTKLGTALALEKRMGVPVGRLFERIGEAGAEELVRMIAIAAGRDDEEFRELVLSEWDYLDLFNAVQELTARILFSGTPEENERKLSRFPGDDGSKNAIRAMLGLPEQKARQGSSKA